MAKRLEPAPPPRAMDQGVAAVYLPLDELRPNPRNGRAHGAEVVRLARTILRTTWGAPIIAQASTRRIIGGHGRLEAARMIAEGVEVDGILRGGAEHFFDRAAPGPLMVPVRLVDVSDAEADALHLPDAAVAVSARVEADLIAAGGPVILSRLGRRERAAVLAELRSRFERASVRLVDAVAGQNGPAIRARLEEAQRAAACVARYLEAAKGRPRRSS